MATEKHIRLLPYGESDFVKLRKGDKFYYVDKTMYIPMLEQKSFQTFLRPRRFGKSLMLNMLAAYYDINFADQFDELFGNLWIGRHPTEERNQYMILKFNFSSVDPDPAEVQKSFNQNVLETLRNFAVKYKDYLPEGTIEAIENQDNSNSAFDMLEKRTMFSDKRIYAIIDEYDNFANTMLADDEGNYTNLTHGDGFFRLFFNSLKAATTNNNAAVSRIMISGVTPLTLSDVTSGYNIGYNISTDFQFNSMVGFTETEFRQMLEYYRDATGVFRHSVDELIEIAKPWYDNNCFSTRAVGGERMFNSDMSLYFLNDYLNNQGELPEDMVDSNIRTDYEKMAKLIRFEKKFGEKTSLIQQITTDGKIFARIKPEFSLSDLTKYENLVSLMFYMGLLSIGDIQMGTPLLVIPNATVNQQYFNYMQHAYDSQIEWKTNANIMATYGRKLAWEGEHEKFFRYIASCMKDSSSNRDFDVYGEAFVKGFFLAQFGADLNYYTTFTERELNHGYSDIYLQPRLGTPNAYVIELKYCKYNSSDAEIDALLAQARTQLPNYIATKNLKQEATDGGWTLHGIILVFNGWELARYERIDN